MLTSFFNWLRKFFKTEDEVAEEGTIWLIARIDNSVALLTKFEFEIIGVNKVNDLFFDVLPPVNWVRRRERHNDTLFIDPEGREVIRQHYYEGQTGLFSLSLREVCCQK